MNVNEDLKLLGLVSLIKRHIEQNAFKAIELNEARSFDICMEPKDVIDIHELLTILNMLESGIETKKEGSK